MPYADYDFYRNMFFGSKIPEDSFLYYAARASEYLDSNFGEYTADEELMSKACCALAEVFYSDEPEQNASSEKVGDYSVTYASSVSRSKSLESRLAEAAARYIPIVGWC
jgi:hypothetical protein